MLSEDTPLFKLTVGDWKLLNTETFTERTKSISDDDEVGGVELASRILGLKKQTIYEWTSQKRLTHYKIGKYLTFKKSDLLKFREQHKILSAEEMISHKHKL